jgi:hypothetical protein
MLAAIERRLDTILQSSETEFPLTFTCESETVTIEKKNRGNWIIWKCRDNTFRKFEFRYTEAQYNGYWPMGVVVELPFTLSFLKRNDVYLAQVDDWAPDEFGRKGKMTVFIDRSNEQRLSIYWVVDNRNWNEWD